MPFLGSSSIIDSVKRRHLRGCQVRFDNVGSAGKLPVPRSIFGSVHRNLKRKLFLSLSLGMPPASLKIIDATDV